MTDWDSVKYRLVEGEPRLTGKLVYGNPSPWCVADGDILRIIPNADGQRALARAFEVFAVCWIIGGIICMWIFKIPWHYTIIWLIGGFSSVATAQIARWLARYGEAQGPYLELAPNADEVRLSRYRCTLCREHILQIDIIYGQWARYTRRKNGKRLYSISCGELQIVVQSEQGPVVYPIVGCTAKRDFDDIGNRLATRLNIPLNHVDAIGRMAIETKTWNNSTA